jgi:tetratricopeptide (TPR) repeat protein
MADRYSYLPYLGALFLMASVADQLVQKRKKVLYAGSIIIALVFMKLCYERVGIWQNSETLWTDVIKKYPFKISQNGQTIHVDQTGVEVAYKNRGNYYREQGKMDLAFNDYAVLVKARVRDPLIYSNMANMYALDNKFKEAMEMYALALERNKNNYEVYLNRGISYSKMQKHQEALKDFQKAAQLFPKNLQIEQSVAAEFLNNQQFDSTIQQGSRLIELFPMDYSGYFYRGTAKINLKQYKEAIVDLNKAVQLKPNDSFVNYNLSIAYNLISDNKNALLFAEKAKMLGYPVQEEFINRIKS